MRSVLALLAVLAVVSAHSPAASAPSGKPVVVGVLYNLTGSMASLDVPGYEGMKLAAGRINAQGGLLGRPLVLEARDCGSDAERCRGAARELVALGVTAIAGLNDSDYALLAGEAATLAGVPFMTAGATLPTLPRLLGPYYFMACFGDDAQAKAVAKFALRRMGADSMLVATNRDHAFTTAMTGYFLRRYRERGGQVPLRVSFTSARPEVAPGDAACLRGGSCKGAFASGLPEDAAPVVRSLRAAGYKGPVYSGDGFDTSLLDALSGEELGGGIFFSTHVAYDDPRPEVERFVRDWTIAHGAPPVSGFAALGHDALGLVADAVARAKSSEPGAVRRALAATRAYKGVTGQIGYPEALAPPLKPVYIMKRGPEGRSLAGEVLP